ncbi:hypothetical protein SCMU_14730 [Sinomonas cyclohexanicum]|uniref:Site-specific recombinase XerD n=1 Tax=Sinomonas cyclohexanicum TaxID=322009 RepID=A0ABM7PTR1_SINCY|nr:site-specific integrase [Corynebacterium cyclohexanicum]BCT75631.1 hypothetical protein SCMU_14730 [Corynebacterium cyclohexanicum]
MASVQPRTRADGTQAYAVLWREGGTRDSRQRSKTFDDPNRAQQLADFLNANHQTYELALDAQEHAYAEGLTITHAAHDHLNTITGVDPGTKRTYEINIRLHILPHLGTRRAADLTRNDVRRWVNTLDTAGLAPNTIAQCHMLLSAIMNTCIAEGIRDDNPTRRVRLPKPRRTTLRAKLIEPAQYRAIVLPEIPEPWRLFVELLAGTGMRVGEAAALTVADYTPGTENVLASVTVTKTWKRDDRARYYVGKPKTDESNRVIDIDDDLDKLLKASTKGRPPTDPLVPDPETGGYISYRVFEKRIWGHATARMTDPERVGGHLPARPTIHWLRHSHGAWLTAAGVDLVTVSRRLGHSNIATTANIYGHPTDAARRTAADAAGRARGGA